MVKKVDEELDDGKVVASTAKHKATTRDILQPFKASTDKPKSKPAQEVDHSASAQRMRLKAALLLGPVSTVQAQRELDIIDPRPRIYELRHYEGLNIHMEKQPLPGHSNTKHKIGVYTLLPGRWEGG